jgi:glycine/D-amino acid oxidase-like deaminating enzyme
MTICAFSTATALAEKLGSARYHGGTHDAGTGHINPLKYVVGLARAASKAGRAAAREHPGTGDLQCRRQGDGEDRRKATLPPAGR